MPVVVVPQSPVAYANERAISKAKVCLALRNSLDVADAQRVLLVKHYPDSLTAPVDTDEDVAY